MSATTRKRHPLSKLFDWIKTVQLTAPMRPNAILPFLYQFSLPVLREGLIYALGIYREAENENNVLEAIRKKQYSDPRFKHAFRFVDRLKAEGTSSIVTDQDWWMGDAVTNVRRPGDIRMFRATYQHPAQRWLTGQMVKHTVEVMVRLTALVRQRSLALRWASGVAQGDVEDARMDYVEREIILNPTYHQPLVLLKAIRNGLVYGTKVRFPHALVMVFLFRSGTVREKLFLIYKATRQHATNLAKFALLYKSGCLLLKNANGGKEASIHTFLAGLFGGYWVFGHGKGASSSVNQQIVIYVFARVVLALAKLAVQPPGDNSLVGGAYGGHGGKGFLNLSEEQLQLARDYSWPVFASMSWASVMWIFRWYPETLQPSLRSSMTYIYSNAEKWDSGKNFALHNK